MRSSPKPSRAEPPAPSGDISDLNLARPEDKVDAPSIPPPSGAVVLFEGTRQSLDQWAKIDGKSPASWELVGGGAMQVKGGNIFTRQKFNGRFKLHVEFRIPRMPGARGQGRGHCGVYLQGRYEVQILDSHGLKSQDNDCGDPSTPGPIRLQDHGNPVQFRNIWLLPLVA